MTTVDRRESNDDEPCPLTAAVGVIGGKWQLIVLWALRDDVRGFNELQRLAPGVSHKVLAETLRRLERDGLVTHHRTTDVPARSRYSLTERGRTVRPVVEAIAAWGRTHLAGEDAGPARSEAAR